jgi:hypothetical protein
MLNEKDIYSITNLMEGLDPKTWRCKTSVEENDNDPHASIDNKLSECPVLDWNRFTLSQS